MAKRLLVVDASLTTRLGTELRCRGRNATTVAAIADKTMNDTELLPKLAVDLAEEEWVLVTGDDAMPAEHGGLIEHHGIAIATLAPWDERKHDIPQEPTSARSSTGGLT